MMFSDPFESNDGTIVITVSRPGWRNGPERPVGLYAVTPQGVTWIPAVDASRHALIGVCIGFVTAVIGTVAVLRRPPWPELTEPVMIALAKERAAPHRG